MPPAGPGANPDTSRTPLRVGVILSPPASIGGGVGYGVVTRPAVTDFCAALSSIMGVEVSAGAFPDYLALLEAMNEGQADLAWLPPVVALRSASQGSTIPLALPIRGGTAWFSAALFTRGDSAITDLQYLRGARVAWVDPQSASGYLVIRAWLRSQGLELKDVFSQEHFLGSHESVVEAVMRGDADVGATYAHLGEDMQWVRSAGWGANPVRVLALAGPIPSDVVAASVRLPVPVIRYIRDILVRHMTPDLRRACASLLQAEGFIAAESEHMAPLVDLLNHFEDTARRLNSVIPPKRP
ncbi:MAG: PhnD/SsuA/transferrin family substrate-binding protein [Deltaproteobacteria bacterium]|nr:PhnD/SsuA/transferrin family substrate-binding protein [Deltaproteobacteria bacterium]